LTFRANDTVEIECDIIKAPIRESGRIDYLNDRADSFTFAYLHSLPTGSAGRIDTSDFLKTPYCISEIPDYLRVVVLGISIYILFKEAKEATLRIISLINDIVALTTSALIPPFSNVLPLAAAIANVILEIAYLTTIIIALVKMISEIFENIIQFKKYKLCMKVSTLFEKGCEYMGLSFSSTILQSGQYANTTIMPRKVAIMNGSYKNPFKRAYNENGNANAYGYYDGTFKQLIIEMQEYFNASCKIINNVLHFERVDYWQNQSSYQIPNKGVPGFTFNYPDPHGTNAAETPANYFLIYQLDSQDQNTYNRYAGTSVQVTCQPNQVNRLDNVLLKNLSQVRFGFALAKRKDHLNKVEEVVGTIVAGFNALVNAILSAVNFVTGIFNAPPIALLPANPMGNRIGWLELSSDFTGVQKIFIGENQSRDWKVASGNEDSTSALFLFQNSLAGQIATMDLYRRCV